MHSVYSSLAGDNIKTHILNKGGKQMIEINIAEIEGTLTELLAKVELGEEVI
ncbi:MAG: hypothetical protein F6K35_34465, partial [Okeania sp. SIO2H7]|nr:hypothetical protein [Okeania sp. SIO2H7]